jgi:hypothetical protein
MEAGVNKSQRSNASSDQTVVWLWRENKSRMAQRSENTIFGDPNDCWIRYDATSNQSLETAFQLQGGSGSFAPTHEYTVDFTLMRQANTATGFQRQVHRVAGTAGATKTSQTTEITLPTKVQTHNRSNVPIRKLTRGGLQVSTSSLTVPTVFSSIVSTRSGESPDVPVSKFEKGRLPSNIAEARAS